MCFSAFFWKEKNKSKTDTTFKVRTDTLQCIDIWKHHALHDKTVLHTQFLSIKNKEY
jgi:hypothetical protein